MNYDLNKNDRARLFQLSEETNLDAVEVILKNAKAYDELKLLVKACMGIDESRNIDLAIVFTVLIKKMRDDAEQIVAVTHAVEKNDILLEQLKQDRYANR